MRPSAVLAVVFPLLLLGLGLGRLGAERPWAPSEAALALDARLEKERPEVVVIGNSKAATDLDPVALRKELGLGPVSVVSVPGTNMPTWYAVVENHLVRAGRRPRLVIVYGTLEWLAQVTVGDQHQRAGLAAYIRPDEPVLNPMVFGRSSGASALDRARDQAAALRIGATEAVRDLGLSLSGAEPEVARAALVHLFENNRGGEVGRRVIPVAEGFAPASATRRPSPAASLLPPLAELAAEAGLRLVVVRSALPVWSSEDLAPIADVREAVAVLNERGAGWIDLSTGVTAAADYNDARHMTPVGRRKNTAALVESLRGIGALDDGALRAARAPLAAPEWRREGELPVLEVGAPRRLDSACGWALPAPTLLGLDDPSLVKLGLGAQGPVRLWIDGQPLSPHGSREDIALRCGGAFSHAGRELRYAPAAEPEGPHELRVGLGAELPGQTALPWLYPGSVLVARFVAEEAADLAIDLRLRVVRGEGAVHVAFGDRALRLEKGARRRARIPLAAARGAVELRIRSEAWAALETLVLEQPAGRSALVGTEPAPARFLDKQTKIEAGPDPEVVGWREDGQRRIATLADPRLAEVDVPAISAAFPAACTPLGIEVGGQMLSFAPVPTAPAAAGPGAWAHHGLEVAVGKKIGGGAPPTVRFDADRRCNLGSWLLPGETLRSTPP